MYSYTVRKSVLWACLSLSVYYAIMEYYYQNFIIPNFPRFGYHLDLNVVKYYEAKFLFVVVLLAAVMTSRKSQFIYSIVVFFIIFFLVPSLVTYSFSNQIPQPTYAIVILLVCLCVISSSEIQIPLLKNNKLSFGLIMLLILISLVPILINFGFYLNINNLLLEDVYDTRELFDQQSNTAIEYLFNWLVKAIIPIALIYFLIHKRYWFAVISFMALHYLYSISGSKIIYVTSFVMLFFFFAGKDFIDKTKVACTMLVIGLLAIYLADYFLGSHLMGLFVMRMLFLPSYLNYFYFDFFEGKPLYFAESHFFNMWSTYPYDRPIGFIIGQNYINAAEMNANNGIIGDGYMNLGYLGVGLNIAIVTAIFLFFNSIKSDPRYLGIFCILIFLFLSAPMLSMFITGGLWFLFLMGITIMPEQKSMR
jgi:hypothetical protein